MCKYDLFKIYFPHSISIITEHPLSPYDCIKNEIEKYDKFSTGNSFTNDSQAILNSVLMFIKLGYLVAYLSLSGSMFSQMNFS